MNYAAAGRPQAEYEPDLHDYVVVSDATVGGVTKGDVLVLDAKLGSTDALVEAGHVVLKKPAPVVVLDKETSTTTASKGEADQKENKS